MVESVVKEMIVNETVFNIDSDDSDMKQKIEKIKSDNTIYDENEDSIEITTEKVLKKSDILSMISEKKGKVNSDYIKAVKKADRESEYELMGPGWKSKDKPHKNKKKYDRKSNSKECLNDSITESVFTKSEVMKMILEKKYSGKVYTKSEFIKELTSPDSVDKNKKDKK